MLRILAWRAPALVLGLTTSVHAEHPALDPAGHAHTNDLFGSADDLRVVLFTRDADTWRLRGAVEIPDPDGTLTEQDQNPLAVIAGPRAVPANCAERPLQRPERRFTAFLGPLPPKPRDRLRHDDTCMRRGRHEMGSRRGDARG